MRGFLATTLLFGSMIGFAHAQGMPSVAPPPEMKAVDFMVGNFKGTANFYMNGQKSPSPCSVKSERALNDRYVHTMIDYQMKMQGMPDMKIAGMHMLTYDPAGKQYVAWWFDGTASTVMHMTGNFDGDKLVLVSDPTPMEPGGPAGVMRTTWWKKGSEVDYLLEMKQGDSWTTFMDGEFHKG